MKSKLQVVDILLDTAKGFHDIGFSCAAYLKNDMERTVIQRAPVGAVNLSFSAELYLKAIHLLKKNSIKGHELHTLFSSLDKKSKEEIKALFEIAQKENKDTILLPSWEMKITRMDKVQDDESETKQKSPSDKAELEEFLLTHNQTFEHWRYNFEVSENGSHLHANYKLFHCLIVALQEFIYRHKRGNDFILYKKINKHLT